MFVERNEAGEVIAVYASFQPDKAEELLSSDSEEVSDFYKRLNESGPNE